MKILSQSLPSSSEDDIAVGFQNRGKLREKTKGTWSDEEREKKITVVDVVHTTVPLYSELKGKEMFLQQPLDSMYACNQLTVTRISFC